MADRAVMSSAPKISGRGTDRWTWAIGALTTAALVAASSRYGYHRDELYFLAAGRHPAWGYADQPPLTPALARAMSWLVPDSLIWLRLPSALIGGIVVVLTAALAREFGAGRAGQRLAAACMAVAGGTLAIAHTLGTSSVDLLFWTVTGLLVLRLLRGADPRWWIAVGVVLGIAMENKWLIGFYAVALLTGVAISGPRTILRSPWLWAGAAIALAIWTPDLLWQAANGWPQLALSKAIAAGASTSSQPWYLFLPMQLLLMSPPLVPVWSIGLARLFGAGCGSPPIRRHVALAWSVALLAAFFMVTGGKPYYMIGVYPLLFGAGAEPVVQWANRRATRLRWCGLISAVGLSLLVNAVISFPVLPASWLPAGPVMAINPDAGETVGWPAFASTVSTVYHQAPPDSVLLMGNYGEAGALDLFGPATGLPTAYSGHNGYGYWGPPSDSAAGSAVVVGIDRTRLLQWFASVQPRATIDDGVALDNQEQGRTVWVCTGLLRPWSQIWPSVRRLG